MTSNPHKEAHIQWQTPPEDSIAEPAILIESYIDVISIQQGDQSIKINYESVDELCRNLKYWANISKGGKPK